MNGDYSQQELLLLSNYAYIPVCTKDAPIKEVIDEYRDAGGVFTADSVAAAAAGGGMTASDVAVVFTEMDKRIEKDPSFGELSLARHIDEPSFRALCYTSPDDANPVVVFRGTGGTTEAWRDNFYGAFENDTRIQKLASEFVEKECGAYTDIVVTGHSKGGNLAQYVTVKNESMIASCVSFDGQGFGEGFLNENSETVAGVSGKITSISAYNDFVNILLTCIAGTVLYVSNKSDAASAHSSVTLLTENEFDDDGNFTSFCRQGPVAKQLSAFTGSLCDRLSSGQASDGKVFGMIAGTAISKALTSAPDDLMDGCIIPSAALAATIKLLTDEKEENTVQLYAHSSCIDTDVCKAQGESIGMSAPEVKTIMEGVNSVRADMAYTIASKLCAERALERVCESLSDICNRLYSLENIISAATQKYERTEKEVAKLLNSQIT